MNRRDAIAALTALPGLTRVSVADIKPTDVIVAEFEGPIRPETAQRIKAQLEAVWPNQKILVCGDGMRLKVIPQP